MCMLGRLGDAPSVSELYEAEDGIIARLPVMSDPLLKGMLILDIAMPGRGGQRWGLRQVWITQVHRDLTLQYGPM